MSRTDYAVFVATADTLNYTRAGRRLGLHASSVARCVERLENRLGLALIEPGGDRLRLTPVGERLSHFLAPLLDRLETGVAEICGDERQGGTLRLMAPPEILLSFVNPIIRDMTARYPGLTVSLEASVGLPDFRHTEIDVFLTHRRQEMTEGTYRISLVGRYAIGLFASPGFLRTRVMPECPEDIRNWPCLSRPGEVSWALHRAQTDPRSEQEPFCFTPETRITATPAPVRLDFACAGEGLVAASLDTCAPYVTEGKLVRVLPRYRLSDGEIFAAQPVRHHPRPVVTQFLSLLVAHLGKAHRAHEIGT
ncbi:LysR family transcriptional regulator [Asaia bogorensis]|uniref:LysR family transcriptional regulator n=1 Tax=Asaia bogorensis TaxID=91915 RepID=UPI00285DC876|nr:LysR family transcriptional regulator [Asaia bogorensis]MDR6181404.1 DNA-binding transcriptional LysR family regulator [Asaia bogorensis NBRC 16594]